MLWNTVSSFCLVALAMVHIGFAQNTPRDYLRVHNAARARVGVGPLQWDQRLARFAHNYINQHSTNCMLKKSGGDPYGENLALSRGDLTGADAVAQWVAQKPYYDYNSNSCIGGPCWSYTQVVWKKSARLGCARLTCYYGSGTIVYCNYDPAGNYENQRPY